MIVNGARLPLLIIGDRDLPVINLELIERELTRFAGRFLFWHQCREIPHTLLIPHEFNHRPVQLDAIDDDVVTKQWKEFRTDGKSLDLSERLALIELGIVRYHRILYPESQRNQTKAHRAQRNVPS